jgi:hypothetical protein
LVFTLGYTTLGRHGPPRVDKQLELGLCKVVQELFAEVLASTAPCLPIRAQRVVQVSEHGRTTTGAHGRRFAKTPLVAATPYHVMQMLVVVTVVQLSRLTSVQPQCLSGTMAAGQLGLDRAEQSLALEQHSPVAVTELVKICYPF